jgi:hypothetical protein
MQITSCWNAMLVYPVSLLYPIKPSNKRNLDYQYAHLLSSTAPNNLSTPIIITISLSPPSPFPPYYQSIITLPSLMSRYQSDQPRYTWTTYPTPDSSSPHHAGYACARPCRA